MAITFLRVPVGPPRGRHAAGPELRLPFPAARRPPARAARPVRGRPPAPGYAALAAGAGSLGYAVSFVILRDPVWASVFLLAGGLLAVPVLVAVLARIQALSPVTFTSAVVLALGAALGSAVHGGYDLANLLHPPAGLNPDLPNPVDPRGLLTFGVAGLALVVLGAATWPTGRFPRWLSVLAVLDGGLLVVLYLARLIVLDPASPLVLAPALLTGFLLTPAWYAGLAVWLLRPPPPR